MKVRFRNRRSLTVVTLWITDRPSGPSLPLREDDDNSQRWNKLIYKIYQMYERHQHCLLSPNSPTVASLYTNVGQECAMASSTRSENSSLVRSLAHS